MKVNLPVFRCCIPHLLFTFWPHFYQYRRLTVDRVSTEVLIHLVTQHLTHIVMLIIAPAIVM